MKEVHDMNEVALQATSAAVPENSAPDTTSDLPVESSETVVAVAEKPARRTRATTAKTSTTRKAAAPRTRKTATKKSEESAESATSESATSESATLTSAAEISTSKNAPASMLSTQEAPQTPIESAPAAFSGREEAPSREMPRQETPMRMGQENIALPLENVAESPVPIGSLDVPAPETTVWETRDNSARETNEKNAARSESTPEEGGRAALPSAPQESAPVEAPAHQETRTVLEANAPAETMNDERATNKIETANSSAPQSEEPRAYIAGDNQQRNARFNERAGRSASEPRDERNFEGRNLRFRGRDGRSDNRHRNENRNGRNQFNRNRDEDGNYDNRSENRGGNRLAPRDNERNRDGERNRDNDREYSRGRDELDLLTLQGKTPDELRELAATMNLEAGDIAALDKNALAYRLLEAQAAQMGNGFRRGVLEIGSDGKGFLRTKGFKNSEDDVYVSQSQIKRFNLKSGDVVAGPVRTPKEMERFHGLLRVEVMNDEAPENMRQRIEFEKLTPIFPNEKFILETTQDNITARVIDLVSPIGKGQRGLIVAPPKAGKTSLIKSIANSISANHPEVELMVLLIDERPEEVTDISRSVKGEVAASTFDELPENHIRVADMVMEKAKRMVEQKKDVVILLDSITRLSRASNLVVNSSGRTMSGGLDPAAMYRPKRMFGAARNIEEGGSLTILATALIDTGSRMDDYIFEEFKGTGNLDLVLDRNLFDMRIFPAIDINKSGTRRDDLLLSKDDLAAVLHLRRTLATLDNDKAINLLIDRLKNTKTNADFMEIVRKSSRQSQAQ